MCRQTNQQPDKGVSGYQPAFLINNLLELQQLLEKVSGSQQNSCENCDKEQATGYCKQCSKLLCQSCITGHNNWKDFTSHQILGVEDVAATASKLEPLKQQPIMECTSHGSPLVVYCDTCDKLICQLCTTAKAHRNHEYEPMIDAFPRHQEQVVDRLQQVKKKLTAITAAVQVLETQERGFLDQIQALRREIEATVQQLIQLLQESERQLMKELDQVTDAYIEKTSSCKKEADITIAQLKSCEEFAEEELRIGSQQEIMVMKRQMVEHMGAVCSQVKEDNLQPLEETILRFVKDTSVVEACRSLGSVVKCSQVKAAGDKTSFDVCNAASNSPISSELVSCQLSPAADPTSVFRCVIQQVVPGSFEVCYPPPITGPHQLRVLVGGADILGTPLTVEVMPKKPGKKYGGFSDPNGMAVTKGDLIVADNGNSCIAIINTTDEKKMRSFGQYGPGQVQFRILYGMSLTQDGHIVVTDWANHGLKVLTIEGAFVSYIGSPGSQPLKFKNPFDVAVHHNGKLFVTDSGNDRVQVLNPDLTYSHSFGSKGNSPGEFKVLRGITIDSEGMVYVADYSNNRVQKFTPEGKVSTVINSKGEREGKLCKPCCVYVDSNDILYVTDLSNNTVCAFSTSGQFLGYVGSSNGSSFKSPSFITSDQYGTLYIGDKNGVITY